jgi:protein-arginine kinase activator protein McsA
MSCSNSAVPRRSKKNKYKSCLSCQNDFEPKRQKQKYCSVSCFHDHRMDKIDREIREGLRDSPTRRTLRRYLIRHRGRSCFICDRSYWNDEEIPIELDHIDGDHTNNELENLRLVCPNCHAQTDTYKGANFGNGRSYRKKYYN